MEDVESNFNWRSGITLNLGEGSEVTLNNAEVSYNEYISLPGDKAGLAVFTLAGSQDPPAELILKGTNSVIGNKGSGLRTSGDDDINVVVSLGATLNAYNNTSIGVKLVRNPNSLTVKNGGAVNACGNSIIVIDLFGQGSSSFFPISGERYTCDGVVNNGNGFTSCENTCPVCALN